MGACWAVPSSDLQSPDLRDLTPNSSSAENHFATVCLPLWRPWQHFFGKRDILHGDGRVSLGREGQTAAGSLESLLRVVFAPRRNMLGRCPCLVGR